MASPRKKAVQGSLQLDGAILLVLALVVSAPLLTFGNQLRDAIADRANSRSATSKYPEPARLVSRREAGAVFIAKEVARQAAQLAADMVGKTSPFPLRKAEQLSGAVPESVSGVKSARFVLVDYDLLRQDFISLRVLSDRKIDSWLKEQVAFISEPQARSDINPSIELDGRVRTALRPPHYGRALVFDVGDGLIEGKGYGALQPTPHRSRASGHSNGMASLAEVLREWQFSQVLDAVSRHSGGELDLVRPYAVVDWGFSTDDTKLRAGALLRQAHNRYPAQYADFAFHNLSNERVVETERVLRRYGITSTGAHRGKKILTDADLEWMNIQGDFDQRRVVDFSSWRVLDESFDPRGLANIHYREPILHASDLATDEAIRLTTGTHYGGGADGTFDKPWLDAFRLSELIEAGEIGLDGIRQFMDERIAVVERKLFGSPAE